MRPRRPLIAINIVTLLAGLTAIAVAIYTASVERGVLSERLVNLKPPLGGFLMGLAVAVVSALGVYLFNTSSDHHDQSTMVKVYMVSLAVLMIVNLIGTALSFAFWTSADYQLAEKWGQVYEHHPEELRKVERGYGCCGWSGPKDRPVPADCMDRYGFVIGCRERVVPAAKQAIGIVSWGGVVVTVLLGVSLVLAMSMLASGDYDDYLDESTRMAEARQLLREGTLGPHQRA